MVGGSPATSVNSPVFLIPLETRGNILFLRLHNAIVFKEVESLDSLKPSKEKMDGNIDVEQLTKNLLPLLASVVPGLLNSSKSDSADSGNNFSLDKIVNMLPTLMVLVPGLLSAFDNKPGDSKGNSSNQSLAAQLQAVLPKLTNINSSDNAELKNQLAHALPALTNALQELTAGNNTDELGKQLERLTSALQEQNK